MNPFPAATLALLLVTGPAAFAGRSIWEYALNSQVRLASIEKGAAANSHPARLDPAALARTLAAVQLGKGAAAEPLFAPAEVEALAGPLAEALAQAGPGQDLELHSTWKRGKTMFASSLAVTARLFMTGGQLNLIVQDPRLDFLAATVLDSRQPQFTYGSRSRPGVAVLAAPGAEARRPDWLVLAVAAAPAAALPAPVAAPVAAPPAAAPAPALPASLEQRLRDLKRFREQGLITEDEYTKGRQELLKELVKGGGTGGN